MDILLEEAFMMKWKFHEKDTDELSYVFQTAPNLLLSRKIIIEEDTWRSLRLEFTFRKYSFSSKHLVNKSANILNEYDKSIEIIYLEIQRVLELNHVFATSFVLGPFGAQELIFSKRLVPCSGSLGIAQGRALLDVRPSPVAEHM
jgi:hypothetical protein